MKKRFFLAALFSWGIITIDQYTKFLIAGYPYGLIRKVACCLNIIHTKNTGAAFSFLAGSGGIVRISFLIILPMLFIAFMLYYAYKKRNEKLVFYSFFMIVAGALSNLIDRVRYGAVVDFLDFYYKTYHYPTFNVADIFVSFGVILLFIDSFIRRTQR